MRRLAHLIGQAELVPVVGSNRVDELRAEQQKWLGLGGKFAAARLAGDDIEGDRR